MNRVSPNRNILSRVQSREKNTSYDKVKKNANGLKRLVIIHQEDHCFLLTSLLENFVNTLFAIESLEPVYITPAICEFKRL